MKLAAVIVLACASSLPAGADDTNASADARAKVLFDEGKTLFAEGQYGKACEKLDASFKLNRLSSTRGLLATCYEKIGKLASAWVSYRDAAAIAEKQGNTERAQAAKESAAELEPKLARVAIDATALRATPSVTVTIDGIEQPLGGLDTPVPLDAGQHLVKATAPEHHPFEHTIDIVDGEQQKLAIPALRKDEAARVAEAERRAAIHRVIRRRKLIAYGVGGAGVAMLGVSTTLALIARSQWNDAQAMGCPPDGGTCESNEAARLGDAASTKATYATYFGLAGLAFAGAGVAIFLTAPSERAFAAPRIAPSATASSVGVSIMGRF